MRPEYPQPSPLKARGKNELFHVFFTNARIMDVHVQSY